MRDYLLDIVQHTHKLGFIDLIKVSNKDGEPNVSAMSDDRSVIVQANFNNKIPEFDATFGMPNLQKLNILLDLPVYREGAKITTATQNREGTTVPVGLHFENKEGDFKNDYRFMSQQIVEEKLKTVKFKGVRWGVELEPSQASIQRLKFQAQANSEELTFVARVENNNLVFYFGDHSTHAGNFVFQHDVAGTLTRSWSWPIQQVLSILSLLGKITMKFSDEGAAMIVVESAYATYEYILPAQTK
jgi:hypothetical protein